MIPNGFVTDLLDRIDIQDVVGKYVQLKKAGSELTGLCPFHQEKTASFTVSPKKQFYHCFGCGAHGNAIGFLMNYAQMSFVDAVKTLATQVGMQVPEERQWTAQEKAHKSHLDLLHETLEKAQEFYASSLKNSEQAQAYLVKRGLHPQTILQFGLGWTGQGRYNLRQVFSHYEDPILQQAGLVIPLDNGSCYDRFRNRITFPIRNARGKLIGFGGRIIGDGQPKYLNSPETELFHKGSELYGLYENAKGIHKASCVLVVEGYMDVVSLANAGVGYAVATLGTATTADHVAKLIKVSSRIVFSFDGDKAGQRAAWRALNVCLPLLRDDVAMRFLFLPPEHDPDSYVRAYGADAFKEQVDQAKAFSTYLLDTLKNQFTLDEPEGRAACLKEAFGLLIQMPKINMRTQMMHEVAKLTQLLPAEFRQAFATYLEQRQGRNLMPIGSSQMAEGKGEINNTNKPSANYEPHSYGAASHRPTRTVAISVMPLAKRLLSLLINHPQLLDTINEQHLVILHKQSQFDLLVQLIALAQSTGSYDVRVWLHAMQKGGDLEVLISGLLNEQPYELKDPETEWFDSLRRIEIGNLEQEQDQIANNPQRTEQERKRYQVISQLIQRLKNSH